MIILNNEPPFRDDSRDMLTGKGTLLVRPKEEHSTIPFFHTHTIVSRVVHSCRVDPDKLAAMSCLYREAISYMRINSITRIDSICSFS